MVFKEFTNYVNHFRIIMNVQSYLEIDVKGVKMYKLM